MTKTTLEQVIMREIWNGKGDAEGKVSFTKNDGTIVGRPHLRGRALRHLITTPVAGVLLGTFDRELLVRMTIHNDEWLSPRNGMLVSAILREMVEFGERALPRRRRRA